MGMFLLDARLEPKALLDPMAWPDHTFQRHLTRCRIELGFAAPLIDPAVFRRMMEASS